MAETFLRIPPLVPSQSCCARQLPQRGSQGDIPTTPQFIKKDRRQVAVHKTGFTKHIIWQLADKGC